MITAVIFYGQSFDRKFDNIERSKTRAKEFIIEISEAIADLKAESLFLLPEDKDSHSPIWFSIKLLEMTQDTSWRSSVSGWHQGRTQDSSWRCSTYSNWHDRHFHDTSWQSDPWKSRSSTWNRPSPEPQQSEPSSSPSHKGRWRR